METMTCKKCKYYKRHKKVSIYNCWCKLHEMQVSGKESSCSKGMLKHPERRKHGNHDINV